MPEYKPIAHSIPAGMVAVYIGSGYWQLRLDAARSLAAQLAIGIQETEIELERVALEEIEGKSHG